MAQKRKAEEVEKKALEGKSVGELRLIQHLKSYDIRRLVDYRYTEVPTPSDDHDRECRKHNAI